MAVMLMLIYIFEFLFSDFRAVVLGIALYSVNLVLFNMGISWVNSVNLSPGFMVRPFLLLTLYFFLKKQWGWSLIFIGVSVYIHLLYSLQFFLMLSVFFIVIFLGKQTLDLKKHIRLIVLAIILVLPLMLLYGSFFGTMSDLLDWELKMARYLVFGHTSLYYYWKEIPVSFILNMFVASLWWFMLVKWGKQWLPDHCYNILVVLNGIIEPVA